MCTSNDTMRRFLVVLAVLAVGAMAQTREQAQRELERTDYLIEQARPVIMESGVASAVELLEAAEETQEVAWDQFRKYRYRLAIEATKKARERLERAAELAKVVPGRVLAEIEKTGRRMREWKPAVMQSQMPRALDRWRLAEREQRSATDVYERKEYTSAAKLTVAARLHAFEAFEIVRRTLNPEKVRKEVEHTEMLLERASEQIRDINDERIHEMLRKAYEFQGDAVDALRMRRNHQALKMTFAARNVLHRGREMARGAVGADAVERELAETDRLIETWREEIKSQGGEEAVKLLARALERQQAAWERFRAEKPRLAWRETGLAQQLLARAIELTRLAEGAPGPE